MPPHHFVDEPWLALYDEPLLDPELPIVDAHHHLWDREHNRYLLAQLLQDIDRSGHAVRATVFMECSAMYRRGGDPAFACVGEVEFANGEAAKSASGLSGDTRACAGIVGHVDLTQGAAAGPVLEAMLQRAPDRFRGIRHMTAFDPSPQLAEVVRSFPAGLLSNETFRQGFACLAPLGLSFDAWVFHPQLRELVALADAFPRTSIILDHAGALVGTPPYSLQHDEAITHWRRDIAALALRPNVMIKLGGMGQRLFGFGFHEQARPPGSEALAAAWRPLVEHCIEHFGPLRSMFESNFPVDKAYCSYRVLWNTFKRLTARCSREDRHALFAGTAVRVYRLEGVAVGIEGEPRAADAP